MLRYINRGNSYFGINQIVNVFICPRILDYLIKKCQNLWTIKKNCIFAKIIKCFYFVIKNSYLMSI